MHCTNTVDFSGQCFCYEYCVMLLLYYNPYFVFYVNFFILGIFQGLIFNKQRCYFC